MKSVLVFIFFIDFYLLHPGNILTLVHLRAMISNEEAICFYNVNFKCISQRRD